MIKNEKLKELLEELTLKMEDLIRKNGCDIDKNELRIKHSYHIVDIAMVLWNFYSKKFNLKSGDKELLKIACLMHYCAKYIDDDTHDKLGSIITCSIMKKAQSKYKELEITNEDIDKLEYMMSKHSDKKANIPLNEFTIYKAILMDADIIEKFNVYHNRGTDLKNTLNSMRNYYNKKWGYIKTPKGREIFNIIIDKIGVVDDEDLYGSIEELHYMVAIEFNNPSNKNIDEK